MLLAYFCLAGRRGAAVAAKLALLGCIGLAGVGSAGVEGLRAYISALTQQLIPQGGAIGSLDGNVGLLQSLAHGEHQGVDHASPVLGLVSPHV